MKIKRYRATRRFIDEGIVVIEVGEYFQTTPCGKYIYTCFEGMSENKKPMHHRLPLPIGYKGNTTWLIDNFFEYINEYEIDEDAFFDEWQETQEDRIIRIDREIVALQKEKNELVKILRLI